MKSKILIVVFFILLSIIGIWYYVTLPQSFEEELDYYREWTKTTPSSGGDGEWVFRNIREEPFGVRGIHLESWEEYKSWWESIEDTEEQLHEVRKMSYKKLRDVISKWKAVYINYDPESKVIWSYAIESGPKFGLKEGVERWVLCYWKAK